MQTLMVTGSEKEAGPPLATRPGAWGAGEFRYAPHDASSLTIFRPDADDRTVTAFREGQVSLAVHPQGKLIAGFVWAIEKEAGPVWDGTIYCWHADPGKWPPLEVPDRRLLPPSARALRLILATSGGVVHAERRVIMEEGFAYGVGLVVAT